MHYIRRPIFKKIIAIINVMLTDYLLNLVTVVFFSY